MGAGIFYAAFAAVILWRGTRSALARLMAMASAGTALWAVTGALIAWGVPLPVQLFRVLDPVRDAGWFTVLLVMLRPLSDRARIWSGLVAVTVALLGADALLQAGILPGTTVLGLGLNAIGARIAASVLGLMLVENLLRNLPSDRLWAIKFLAIAVTFQVAAELLLRIPQFLGRSADFELLTVRAGVALLVLPLLVVAAVRSPSFQLQVHSSRRIVLHLATLVVIGVVLQGTAIAAFYVRRFGGDNGTVLALVLSFAALIALTVFLASASFRSRLSLFISENFFNYKYDYRLEWGRFIRAMSNWQDEGMRRRALRTLCDLLDCPSGTLLLAIDGGRRFATMAEFHGTRDIQPIAADEPDIQALMDDETAYLDLAQSDAVGWRSRAPGAWLVVPLRDAGVPIGIAVLEPPRAPRQLDWEDRHLIEIVALQLGAYLMQEETARALADARQLEAFNQRFAFIVHDIKNTIGQLSLLMRNVEKFGHDAEFRKDMVATVSESVARLQELLTRLKAQSEPVEAAKPAAVAQRLDLAALLGQFAERLGRVGTEIVLADSACAPVTVLAPSDALVTVLDHVVGNAVEVSPAGEPVVLSVEPRGSRAALVVADRGPGMSARFIAEELFRPLRSTKGGGFGIGAFQAREVMRQLGGDIEVDSEVGNGTRIVLLLPLAMSERERISA